jgi:hypothetical protein
MSVTTKSCHYKGFPDLDQENTDYACVGDRGLAASEMTLCAPPMPTETAHDGGVSGRLIFNSQGTLSVGVSPCAGVRRSRPNVEPESRAVGGDPIFCAVRVSLHDTLNGPDDPAPGNTNSTFISPRGSSSTAARAGTSATATPAANSAPRPSTVASTPSAT